MPDPVTPAAPVEQPKDFGQGGAGLVKRYMAEIALYEREFQDWERRCDGITKRYRDERPSGSKKRKMNILWSNMQVLGPAVYARAPKPSVERRFKDADPLARAASEVLERCLSYQIEKADLDAMLKKDRDDYLLTARGVSWNRYEPVMDGDQVATEYVCGDYVYWKDFGHTPKRSWEEIAKNGRVWRRLYQSRAQLVKRFGKIGNEIKLDSKPTNMSDDAVKQNGEVFKMATIYEIWDAETRQAIWIAKSYTAAPLDVKDDPLGLEGFFPCPKPLYGTLTNDNLIPIPDYAQYQDQAEEVDLLTSRIALLTKALKVAGFYNAASKENFGKLINGDENTLIPVDNWAFFAEKGGTPGQMSLLPLGEIAKALEGLYAARAQVKQDLLEVTGLSDIVRGQGNPNETATAQQIKGRFASMRLTDRQGEMIRFARDNLRIQAEIIAEHFAPETLAMMSGVQLPMTKQEAMLQAQAQQQQPGPSWEDVVGLLRNDKLRGFRIDIETDSTVALDQQADQESMAQLLGEVTPFLDRMAAAAQQMPAALPLLGELLMTVLRKFRVGRNLEQRFETTLAQLEQMAQQPKADPHQQQMQMDAAKAKQEMDIQQAKAQQDSQLKQMDLAHQAQIEQQRLGMEAQKMRAEHELKRQDMLMNHELKRHQMMGDQQVKMAQASAKPPVIATNAEGKVADYASPLGEMQQGMQATNEGLAAMQQGIAGVAQAVAQLTALVGELAKPKPEPKKRVTLIKSRDGMRTLGAEVTTMGTA